MILELNLQFFAKDGPGGEKTEQPTSKKLSDARKEGQVAKSKEIANCLGLLAFFLVLKVLIGYIGNSFLAIFSEIYNKIPEAVTMYQGNIPEYDFIQIIKYAVIRLLYIVGPILAIGFLVAFLSEVVQVKWQVTTKPLMPKLSKMSPISGFKKIISVNSLVELLKSVLKIALIGIVIYNYINDKKEYIFFLYDMSLLQALQLIGDLVIDLGIKISVIYAVIALADYIYQKIKFKKDMMMTKQEVKDEYKQQEGDPQVKGKIRAKMREVSQRRMMQSLPQADVVITNPTHYAVAIKYDPEQYDAPIVLAKGEDYLAQKIKEVAREHNVEIVENKPLARMLYANVDVGQLVPPELYQAVAEVLAFVYQLKGKI